MSSRKARESSDPRADLPPIGRRGSASETALTPADEERGGSALDRLRSEVADALERRLDEVERDVREAIPRRVPAYEALARDPATAEEVHASVGAIVRVFVDLVREARPFSQDELALMRDVGIRRAHQGLTADDIHRAAHTALKVGLRHLRSEMQALGVTDTTFEAAGEIAEALHDYVNEFTRAAGGGVHEVEERRAGDRANERAELIGRILDGALGDEVAIRDSTAEVGHPLRAPCTLVVLAPSRPEGARPLAVPMSKLLEGHDGLLRGPVRSTPIPHAVAVASGESDRSTSELLRRASEIATSSELVVVAERIDALSELSPAYRWVCELLGVPLASRTPGIVEIEDLAPRWLVGALPTGPDLIFTKRIVGPLLACDETTRDRVIATVDAYFRAEGSIKDTAEALEVDRRTVERHLARFEEVTGRSLRVPSQQLLVQAALHLLELRGPTFPSPGDASWGPGARTLS